MSAIHPDKTTQTSTTFSPLFYSPGDPTQARKLTFSAILLEFGLKSLQGARGAFQTQFERAQEMVKCMEDLNKLMQSMNNYKSKFNQDAKGDTRVGCKVLQHDINNFNKKYPNAAISYEAAGFQSIGNAETTVSYSALSSIISNAQTVQSTLSSQNEQQSMRTNQAMNRSSGYLQQLQAMLQAAKEGIQAAAKAGGS